MGKAFASPRRLELLDLLAQAPRTRRGARAGQRAVDREHLPAPAGAPRRRAWSRARARARSVRYALAGDEALALWLALRDASVAQLGEVERAARDYLGEDVETIGREELLERLGRGDVVLVDVRPARGVRRRPHRGRALDPARRAASSAWPSFRPTARSSPTAAARSAPTRTRPSAGSTPPAARRAGWRTAGPNGASRPPSRRHEDRCRTTRRRRRPARRDPRTYPRSPAGPTQDFIFPTGRAGRRSSAIPSRELARVPEASVASFAGVANPARSAGRRRARPCWTSVAGPAPTC